MIRCTNGQSRLCARTPGPFTNQLVWPSKTIGKKVIYDRVCTPCRELEQAQERYRRYHGKNPNQSDPGVSRR